MFLGRNFFTLLLKSKFWIGKFSKFVTYLKEAAYFYRFKNVFRNIKPH